MTLRLLALACLLVLIGGGVIGLRACDGRSGRDRALDAGEVVGNGGAPVVKEGRIDGR